MKKIVFTLLILFIGISSNGQESNLIGFYPSFCDENEDVLRIRDRVSNVFFRNDTLFVSVGFVANCGFESEHLNPGAQLLNDTLYLSFDLEPQITDSIIEGEKIIYFTSLNYVDCDCCFEFMYLLKNIPHDSIPIKLNNKNICYHKEKYKTYPIQFEIHKGDTINFIDKYGFRQGKWLLYKDSELLLSERIYKNDSILLGTDFRYYENNTIKAKLEWLNNEYQNYSEYDESGKLTIIKRSPFDK
ncbi:hypothetical protein [Carboxylicivirga marina]|uniref:hypothetical protein n=1 Tax=Carboxylicivirga marina TaxID=2800988 RepID=UPI0025961A80|nr:hypothetical protein [uncultured Carboxylicivirga sp.]